MSVNTRDLELAITESLKPGNFRKRGTSWYLETPECISLLDLQKSQWGGQYYINLGALIKQLSTTAFPKEHHCHIRGRLSHIVPDKIRLEKCLDLEDVSFSSEERVREISRAIKTEALPLLLSFRSLGGIKELLQTSTLENFLVSVKVRELFGMSA